MTTKKTKPTDEMIALALSMSAGMQPTSDIEEIRRRLPKEFRPYLVGDGPLGAMIRHPLYYSIVFGGSTFEIDLLVEGVAMKEKAIAVQSGGASFVLSRFARVVMRKWKQRARKLGMMDGSSSRYRSTSLETVRHGNNYKRQR